MVIPTNNLAASNIPERVFEKYLGNLKEAGVSETVIARLRKVLIEERRLNEAALKAAILTHEPIL